MAKNDHLTNGQAHELVKALENAVTDLGGNPKDLGEFVASRAAAHNAARLVVRSYSHEPEKKPAYWSVGAGAFLDSTDTLQSLIDEVLDSEAMLPDRVQLAEGLDRASLPERPFQPGYRLMATYRPEVTLGDRPDFSFGPLEVMEEFHKRRYRPATFEELLANVIEEMEYGALENFTGENDLCGPDTKIVYPALGSLCRIKGEYGRFVVPCLEFKKVSVSHEGLFASIKLTYLKLEYWNQYEFGEDGKLKTLVYFMAVAD